MQTKIIETFAKPSTEEMQGRLGRVQAGMARLGLDCYVSTSHHNALWLTNFANIPHERPFILVVPAKGRMRFLSPKLEVPHFKSRMIGDVEVATYAEFPAPAGRDWAAKLRELVPANARVATESTSPVMVCKALHTMPEINDLIDDLRMVKSAYEVSRMAYAARLVSEAHAQFLENARPGVTQTEVRAAASGYIGGQLLADDPNYNPSATKLITMFQNADASDDPHNFSNINMAMREGGPHVSVFNVELSGYGGEIERCFFLGHVPEAAKRPFEVMMQARQLCYDMVRPGVIMGDVDRAVNELFRKAGYGDNLLHRAGHGMGITAHEAPFLADGDEREILAGMSFTLEPGIYVPGTGGFRHSDTVVVTENGLEQLTFGAVDLDAMTLAI